MKKIRSLNKKHHKITRDYDKQKSKHIEKLTDTNELLNIYNKIIEYNTINLLIVNRFNNISNCKSI